MTPQPPRLALALLQHVAAGNEPLVGDLVEQFATRRRSRLWFWRQVLLAVLVASRLRHADTHPLHLADDVDDVPVRKLPARVNLSASPLPDVGGLGLLIFILIAVMLRPEAWWMAVVAVLGGAIFGVVLVIVRRPGVRSRFSIRQ